jgi:hypothetical protein
LIVINRISSAEGVSAAVTAIVIRKNKESFFIFTARESVYIHSAAHGGTVGYNRAMVEMGDDRQRWRGLPVLLKYDRRSADN